MVPTQLMKHALAGEFVSCFLDGIPQRGVAGQRLAGDPDLARGHVDIDLGDTRELADLGPDGIGAVVTAHAGDHDRSGFHAADPSHMCLQ